MKHLRSLLDLTSDEFHEVLAWSLRLKQGLAKGHRPDLLKNRTCALVFEKASLRTRVSFETAMAQLGGVGLYLTGDAGWRERESISDFVRVLGEYNDFLVCRTFSQSTIEELAKHNVIPVINGLTDESHPCQAIADIFTILEDCGGKLQGKQLTFVGDGNNVVRSLAQACALVGMRFRLACPQGYQLADNFIRSVGCLGHFDFEQSHSISKMVRDTDYVYTDVWTSMGQEAENEARKKAFAEYQINGELMKLVPAHCKVLHCLPARRGLEITDEVIDSTQSLVFKQAGNRLHAQKGLLIWLSLQNRYLSEHDLKTSL